MQRLVAAALATILAATALGVGQPLSAAPEGELLRGVEMLLAAERLGDPLRAAAVIQGMALPAVVLERHTDLHAAWHDAYASNGAPFLYAEHAKAHQRLATIPPDFAAETAILLSGINHCTRLLARDDAALRLACAVALADLIEERLPHLQAAPGPASAGEDCITGLVRIGTTGDDCYDGAAPETVLSIDPAGDDAYANSAGANGPTTKVAVALDIGGNDAYTNEQGSGKGGIGILVDAAGDDAYESMGDSFQASGWIGIGIVADLGGYDRFLCAEYCQGFAQGTRAAGILWDLAGNDVRRMGLSSPPFLGQSGQGFGATNGLGLLVDATGSDVNIARGLAQGSADLGTGVLIDKEGGDSYALSFETGRAASTIPGSAVFLDLSGTDTYSGPSPGANDATWGPGLTPPTYKRGKDCESGTDPLACILGFP